MESIFKEEENINNFVIRWLTNKISHVFNVGMTVYSRHVSALFLVNKMEYEKSLKLKYVFFPEKLLNGSIIYFI